MKPILTLLVCLFSALYSKAQQPSLYFEKLTTEHGLSHNQVNCVLQDQRGFIWIGTNSGLNRYDGKNFVHFFKRAHDSTTISGNIITDLLEDKEGRLWVATADGGLNRYDYRLEPAKQFKNYRGLTTGSSNAFVNIVNTIVEDRLGYLWVGTSGYSVLRFDKKKERFEDLIPYGTKTIIDLSLDNTGVIWAGRQGGGILRVNPHNLAYEQDNRYTNLYAKLPHASVTALHQDRYKYIWYGSWDKVLYRYNPMSKIEEVFASSTESYSFNNDQINAFAEDAKGRLWMGGNAHGLQIFDPATSRFYQYRYDASREGTLADNHINCIFIDKSGMVWIGTNRGLSISNPRKQQFTQTFLPASDNGPITIYDFFEEGNEVWIGTNDGMYTFNPSTNGFSHQYLYFQNKPIQPTKFYKDVDGRIYLGTNVSLFLFDPKTKKLSLLPNTDKDKVMNAIIDSRVVSIQKDTIDNHPVLLTIPYGHFIAYYDLTEKRWISRLDSSKNILARFNLKDNLVRKFVRTRDGRKWLATAKWGLGAWEKEKAVSYFFNEPGNSKSISNNHVYDMVEDSRGNLWVSTYGSGLHYFDVKNKSFKQISATTNLTEGLQIDEFENVWMIGNGELHKYDPRRGSYTNYDLPDLEKTGGVKGMMFKDSKGYLYAAGVGYFVRFHPTQIKDVQTEPKVWLTDFSIFNHSVSHYLFNKEIELSYKDNYFTVEFAAPDFSGSGSVQYAYQLEGFNNEWVEAGSRNFVSYSNLDGGNYRFKVKASISPGVWSREQATISIVIVPPFWKEPSFYILCFMALAALIYGVYRYRINELLKRQAIRNKIAQDLHDNVGSTLSSISVYSQVAKIYHDQEKQNDLEQTLEKISAASSEMISELNDTVWAINPRNDHMNVILQRMESFARPLLSAKGIKFHFSYDSNLMDINLSMEKRKNFYLIYKEAINNTLKYADCKNISVNLGFKGTQMLMQIEDDGKGFDLKKSSEGFKSSDVYGGGNGLKNMQLRAKEMNAQLNISSEIGGGTCIMLLVPVTGFGDFSFAKKK